MDAGAVETFELRARGTALLVWKSSLIEAGVGAGVCAEGRGLGLGRRLEIGGDGVYDGGAMIL